MGSSVLQLGLFKTMATAIPGRHECPVCHDTFTEPKLLPCTHRVCKKCVCSWMKNGGDQNGCPLCRAPILPDAVQGETDLEALVDALPTDLVTAAEIESQKVLGTSHVCSCCDEDTEATKFCLQCAIKMCNSCAKTHAKIPAARDHVSEELSSLSADQLALHFKTSCVNHSGTKAELYCTKHEVLICLLCATSTHRKCEEVEGMGDMARTKREELKTVVQKLGEREKAVDAQIDKLDAEVCDGQTKFKAMRDEVKTTFDGLQTSLDAKRQQFNEDIQKREEAFLAERKSSKLDLENHKASLTANKSTAEVFITSAPDGSLLGMMGKLKSRLEELESKSLPDDPKTTTGKVEFNLKAVDKIKEALGFLDQLNYKPEGLQGPDYAAVIKVGDRVSRGRDWSWENQDGSPPGLGTVIEVPGNMTTQWVRVKWDCGKSESYRMGAEKCYDLKFVSEGTQ